jgi:hypothetical protein
MMSTPFECRVGGVNYHTTIEILSSVPESYFTAALSKNWKPVDQTFLKIDRDGTHFQHILDFLRFGYLPRDSTGRCHIPKEVLVQLSVEADFYGLSVLVKEIEQMLKFDLKGMRYFISEFYLNSGPSGGLTLKEFSTYEAASLIYDRYKEQNESYFREHGSNDAINNIIHGKDMNYGEGGQNIVIIEDFDPKSGKEVKQVFEDGYWKRPSGTELLCIPISSSDEKDASLYSCKLRTHPDNRNYV